MQKEPEQDKYFYITGWACIGLVLVYLFFRYMFKFDLTHFIPPCTFYSFTGFYCPGCGGTRAVLALLRGDIFTSIFYHPVVPYVAVVGGWFMISQTVERLSRGKWNIAMSFRMIYVWILLALLTINFVWKNGVLFITGVAPM